MMFLVQHIRTKLSLILLQFTLLCSTVFAQSALPLPAYGPYNFFNDHRVYIECNNLSGERAANVAVSLLRDDGEVIQTKNFSIPPLGTIHVDARDYQSPSGASLNDTYGLVKIADLESSPETEISCVTAFYKPRQGSNVPEYAFVIPFAPSQQGDVWGMYNSIDPGEGLQAVENYVSISNPGTERLSGEIDVFDQSGSYSYSDPFSIAPGGRIDRPLGHQNNRQQTGLYRIRPYNSTQQYISFAARYHLGDLHRHNFGFSLATSTGICNEALLASTMAGKDRPATNWLELGNPHDSSVSVTIEAFDRVGNSLYRESINLAARSQWNLYLNPIIDPERQGNVGSVKVFCDSGNPILAQTTFYGHAASAKRVIWAYVSQAEGKPSADEGQTLIGSANTHLGDAGAANWLKLTSALAANTPVEVELLNPEGHSLTRSIQLIAGQGTLDYDIHSLVGPRFVGTIHIRPLIKHANITGELIRVYLDSDGSVGSIMPTPLVLTDNDTHGDGCEVVAHSRTVNAMEMTSVPIEVTAETTCAGNIYYELVSRPSFGTLSGTLPNVNYRATNHYRGQDRFLFKATVAGRPSGTAEITINVAARSAEFAGIPNSLERYRNQLTEREVEAYLNKIAFGGTAQLKEIGKNQGLDALIEALLSTPVSAETENDANFWAIRRKAGPLENPHSRWTLSATQHYWYYLLLFSENPFRERMALLWHTQFATNLADIGLEAINNARAMPDHVALLRQGSLGNVVTDIVNPLLNDVAMNVWLNNKDNHRERPNQNFARELMELFLLGARDPITGVANYSESSIPGATAFVSGFELITGNPWRIRYNAMLHDNNRFRIFEETPGAYVEAGQFSPTSFVEHIAFNHPGSARFIAERVYAQLVNPVATEEIVSTLANDLLQSGFDVRPMLRRMLAASANFISAEGQSCIASPTSTIIRFIRSLNIPRPVTTGVDPYDDANFPISLTRFSDRILNTTVQSLITAGQAPGLPPTVFAWEGECGINRDTDKARGEAWLATQLLLERGRQVINLMNNLDIYFNSSGAHSWINLVPVEYRSRTNPTPSEVRAIAEHLVTQIVGLTLSTEKQSALIDAIVIYLTTKRIYDENGGHNDRDYVLNLTDNNVVSLKIPGALQLITSHIQYLLN